MKHPATASPQPKTYTTKQPIGGPTLRCSRCARVYAFPQPGDPDIRCECGWRYRNVNGLIEEEFKSRIGV